MSYKTLVYLCLFLFFLCDNYTFFRPEDFISQLSEQIEPDYSPFFQKSQLSVNPVSHFNEHN